jgi:hypothetical protein
MDAKGIMQQIREHLAQGKSRQEVIALGYAPGSVYKVQRQLRRTRTQGGSPSAPVRLEASPTALDPEVLARIEKLESKNAELSAQVTELLQERQDASALESRCDQLQERVEGVAAKVETTIKETSLKVAEQRRRIESLEQQAKALEETVSLIVPLVYHLDVHHRRLTHGWPTDSTDEELGPSNAGYKALLQTLRQVLSQNDGFLRRSRRFRLPVQLLSSDSQQLGVSKATVVNYLKGYPYQPR